MPNKLSQFWQELKRRKVTRVLTVYAAASFVILQLIEILAPSLRLPEWTMNFILVLLIVGFIIAIIISWMYDIHPEGGIVKTEPADKIKAEDIPKSSNGWKIASYISFAVILGLIVLNIIPRTKQVIEKEILDKSIAVLPFINDSQDKDNEHLINGIMEEILINLQSIKELRVPARTSIEQYRNNPKPVPEIASELNVAYIVEGSGQRYGKKLRLRVQLVEGATDKHIWADSYDEEINEPEDIFRIQSQIAESIAAELEAIITPEEKLLIEKIPTTNLTAYDLYQRGRDELNNYWLDNDSRTALERAEELYHQALDYDTTFAQAYTGLAYIYWHKHYWETYFSESFLDSVFILADKALSFDPQLSEAYTVRGNYYRAKGQNEQAITEYEKAIKLNPNDWFAYLSLGYTFNVNHDYVKAIDNLHKSANLYRGSLLPSILRNLAWPYLCSGFPEKYQFYRNEAFILDGDSISNYSTLAHIESYQGNFDKQLNIIELQYLLDTTRNGVLANLGYVYMRVGRFEESLLYLKKYFERLETLGSYDVANMQRLGYAYWMNGFYEEANFYFDKMIEYYNNLTNVGREMYAIDYDLAGVYAFRGEKDRAYENLRKFNEMERIPHWWLVLLKDDPLFNSIRDESEFQQIVRDMEVKYHAEHERVKQWLVENDML
jgi:TolB-like protein